MLNIDKKVGIIEYFLIFSVLSIFAEICFISYLPAISYFDEIITLLFFFTFISRWIFKPISMKQVFYLLLLVILFILGISFNIIYKIQSSQVAIAMDAFSVVKVFLILLSTYNLFDNVNTEYCIKTIVHIFSFIIVIILGLAFINLFFNIGMEDERRYGIKSFRFICQNAGQFNYCCYYLIVISTLGYVFRITSKKKSVFLIGSSLLLAISTLRSRTFVFVLLYIFIFYYFTRFKKKNIFAIALILLIGFPFFIYMSYGQFEKYFNNENSARYKLLETSLRIFKDYFPFGTGFGTYGTASAASYYSPLYYEYGLNTVWGLYPTNPDFASDNYWPSILAQFGFIGVIIIITLLMMSFMFYMKKIKSRQQMICLAYISSILLLSSLVTASFYHYSSIGLIIILSLACSKNMMNKGEKYEKLHNCSNS